MVKALVRDALVAAKTRMDDENFMLFKLKKNEECFYFSDYRVE